MDALKGRFSAPPGDGLNLTVAGEHLGTMPLEENEGALRKLLGFETVSGEQLVADSSFSFSPQAVAAGDGGAGGGGQWSVWGQGALSSFSGQEDGLSLNGDVTTALVGADWRAGRWQVGAALSRSWGNGSYEGKGDNGDDGRISATLTGLFPYGRYALSPRLGMWATGGYGWGSLTLKLQGDSGEELDTDTNLVMGAVGLEGVLLDGGADGITLTTTTDLLSLKTVSAEVKGLKSSAASISRLRLGLEATRPFPMDNGAALLPSLEVGLRQDSGDAETGYGVEVGAGVVWKDAQRGIRGEVKGRTLLTHTEEEFRQQGLALSFAWDPSPSNRGPSLSMGHTMGAGASGGMDTLLSPTVIQGLDAPDGSGQHFEAEVAYGFPTANDRLTMTPEVALALSPTSRTYGLLWSLAPYSEQGQGEPWEIALEAERQERNSATSPVDLPSRSPSPSPSDSPSRQSHQGAPPPQP
ncbi:MAG: autotransporter outer membrane beta-barrel domain-containing protein [Cyanobacteria bacterium MAG CAR2_bin_4]|nr:autotransporter outer membrane beta-barrel domain-containing protein [Cyanobacteria bacterium MAG CAR2_bin_4]